MRLYRIGARPGPQSDLPRIVRLSTLNGRLPNASLHDLFARNPRPTRDHASMLGGFKTPVMKTRGVRERAPPERVRREKTGAAPCSPPPRPLPNTARHSRCAEPARFGEARGRFGGSTPGADRGLLAMLAEFAVRNPYPPDELLHHASGSRKRDWGPTSIASAGLGATGRHGWNQRRPGRRSRSF